MARVVISTAGSSGDLHPYIALGLGLRLRGHAVVFAVEESFAGRLRAEGFETLRLRGDMRAQLTPYAHEMVSGADALSSLRIMSQRYLAPPLRENIALLRDLCADADLLIASVGQIAASAVAELSGVRWVTVALSPALPSAWVAPTRAAAWLPAGAQRAANRALWALGGAAIARASDAPLNAVRAAYGLPPRHRLLGDGALSPTLTAVAVSPAFFPRPPDWPTSAQVTGFLYWDVPADWREPPALAEFLSGASGARSVVAVSSGSMGADVGDAFADFFAASVAAIQRAGARALVIGAGDAFSEDGPDTLRLDYAPFSLIYPRCAAVIHHGGAGTLGQSLRAGVPTLITPWGADQFFHALLAERAGVGRTLARRRFTAERARAALTALLHEPRYRERAQTLGRQIAQEDGVGALCDAIETALAQPMQAGKARQTMEKHAGG